MSILVPIRFLLSNGDFSAARTVLVVQSGSPELLAQAVDLVRARLPSAAVTVLLQRNMAGQVPEQDGVEYIENTGSKVALSRRLRGRRFDAAFVLYVNQPGFWKLKLLPFVLGARHVIAVNEKMGCFPVGLRHPWILARHLSWRMGGRASEGALMAFSEGLVRAAVLPAVIARLAVYETLASLRADSSWKKGTASGSKAAGG